MPFDVVFRYIVDGLIWVIGLPDAGFWQSVRSPVPVLGSRKL